MLSPAALAACLTADLRLAIAEERRRRCACLRRAVDCLLDDDLAGYLAGTAQEAEASSRIAALERRLVEEG